MRLVAALIHALPPPTRTNFRLWRSGELYSTHAHWLNMHSAVGAQCAWGSLFFSLSLSFWWVEAAWKQRQETSMHAGRKVRIWHQVGTVAGKEKCMWAAHRRGGGLRFQLSRSGQRNTENPKALMTGHEAAEGSGNSDVQHLTTDRHYKDPTAVHRVYIIYSLVPTASADEQLGWGGDENSV